MKYLLFATLSVFIVGCGGNETPNVLPPELLGNVSNAGLPPISADPLAEFPIEALTPVTDTETAVEIETETEPTPPVLVANANVSCEAITQDLETSFADMNFCDTNDDCAVAQGSCPFGCFLFHNVDIDFADYQPTLTAYQENCNPCEYQCASSPRPNDRRCVEGRCVDTRYSD
jgi:hypothetical protein